MCTRAPSFRNYFNNLLTYLFPTNALRTNGLNIILYESEEFSVSLNKEILKSAIKILKALKRFDIPLY